jgi:hypothetical protein
MEETRTIVLVALAICLLAIACPAQDSPSLGDLARQQRQQKEQAKATSNKPRKVITNDQLPERSNESSKSGKVADKDSVSTSATENGAKPSGEEAKSQILAEKNQISSLQAQIDELNQSIHFAPANCVANCVSWNERQEQKQKQVEEMQAQLEEQKKQLEEMQESARKLGYGSSVYDP